MDIHCRTIKEELEELELEILSPFATKCINSKGRKRQRHDKFEIRTEFQRDRDKILHSKSFRRLKHKTQVFLSPYNDHFRTRLTHTLEVAQIARTMARALKLNEDLFLYGNLIPDVDKGTKITRYEAHYYNENLPFPTVP